MRKSNPATNEAAHLKQVTPQTGQVRRSPRSEVAAVVVDQVRPTLTEALRADTTCQVPSTGQDLSACVSDGRPKFRLSTDTDIGIQAQVLVRAAIWPGTWSHLPWLALDLALGIVGVKPRRLMECDVLRRAVALAWLDLHTIAEGG